MLGSYKKKDENSGRKAKQKINEKMKASACSQLNENVTSDEFHYEIDTLFEDTIHLILL